MCFEAVDDSLTALKLIPDLFVTIKIILKSFTALYADENILNLNEDSGDAIFSNNEMNIVYIDLNKINLDDNFDQRDPNTMIPIRLLAWHIKFRKRKDLKNN